MKILLNYIFIALFLLYSALLSAQFNPDKICTVEKGKTIFKLDLRWSESDRKQLEKLFELDSALISKVYSGEVRIMSDSIIWQVKKISDHMVELSMLLDNLKAKGPGKNDLFIADDSWLNYGKNSQLIASDYGVNNFKLNSAFSYRNHVAQFFLPGNSNAKNIFISGTFNEWSVSASKMQRCDSGWIFKLKLSPGKYLYKYIIDGRWTEDLNNKLKVKDGEGSHNSVVFCENYTFELTGKKDARKVIVSGSFNHWKVNELYMTRSPGGWILPVYLREGTHAYKFIVDGVWINDPANKHSRPDGNGGFNSYIGIGDPFNFHLLGFGNATKVILAGNFNAWNNAELEMQKTSDGWKIDYILAAGMYEYKFIVDGKWILDPGNPYTVGSDPLKNSVLAYKANYIFRLAGFAEAKEVIVTGSFTRWNPKKYKMALKDGIWYFPCYLTPGKYDYKFIVDGKWILDPANTLWEENEFNTGNSVLWLSH